jgi:hypothetical protein
MTGANVWSLTKRAQLERFCDVASRANLVQLQLFRAAADGVLAVARTEDPACPWPKSELAQFGSRPIVFVVAADPGFGHPDPHPEEWTCAKRLKY